MQLLPLHARPWSLPQLPTATCTQQVVAVMYKSTASATARSLLRRVRLLTCENGPLPAMCRPRPQSATASGYLWCQQIRPPYSREPGSNAVSDLAAVSSHGASDLPSIFIELQVARRLIKPALGHFLFFTRCPPRAPCRYCTLFIVVYCAFQCVAPDALLMPHARAEHQMVILESHIQSDFSAPGSRYPQYHHPFQFYPQAASARGAQAERLLRHDHKCTSTLRQS